MYFTEPLESWLVLNLTFKLMTFFANDTVGILLYKVT